jgi:hypothetical protein
MFFCLYRIISNGLRGKVKQELGVAKLRYILQVSHVAALHILLAVLVDNGVFWTPILVVRS